MKNVILALVGYSRERLGKPRRIVGIDSGGSFEGKDSV